MKKILSILLALSVACGSIMLTACGDKEKEDDDDDKSVSDKDRDDKDDKDEDDDKDDKDDEDDKDDKDDKDDEDDDKSDKDDDESSKDDDESSEDEEVPSSSEDDEGDEGEKSYDYEYLNTFSELSVEIFGRSYSFPFAFEPFCEYYDLDADEMIAADDWDWYEDDTTEVDMYNPSENEETALSDCYVDYVYTEESTDVFEFTINGVGVGSSVDDINDAFGTEFTISNGEIDINDDEYWMNYITFNVEDDMVIDMTVHIDDEYFASDDDDEDWDDDTASYSEGDVVVIEDCTFVVPDGFEGESYSDTDYTFYPSSDEMAYLEVSYTDEIESPADYPIEFFEAEFEDMGDALKDSNYELTTISGYDTIKYSCTISADGESMDIAFYIIFTDNGSYSFGAYAMDYDFGYIDEAAESIVIG